jgi:hypothetical protein
MLSLVNPPSFGVSGLSSLKSFLSLFPGIKKVWIFHALAAVNVVK